MVKPDVTPGGGGSPADKGLSLEDLAHIKAHIQASQAYFRALKEAQEKGEPKPAGVIGDTQQGTTQVIKR